MSNTWIGGIRSINEGISSSLLGFRYQISTLMLTASWKCFSRDDHVRSGEASTRDAMHSAGYHVGYVGGQVTVIAEVATP
jgi:hypothetical protein